VLFGCAGWRLAAGFDLLRDAQVHGFLSQGAIHTSANNFFGHTDGRLDFDYTEIGLNASVQPLQDLRFAGQTLFRRAGEGADGGLELDYGFADYTLLSSLSGRAGVRLGRVLNPLGFYNETRDVLFTRPSILLPQSIYFDRTRNLSLSADGVNLYAEHRRGNGEFFLQWVAGFPRADDQDAKLSVLGPTAKGELTSKLSFAGRLLYEHDGGRLRLALSGAQGNFGYNPVALDPWNSGKIEFDPLIFSFQYNDGPLSLTSELALRKFKLSQFGSRGPNGDTTGESYYLQGTYRFAPRWEGLVRYDVLYRDRNDRNGKDFEQASRLPRYLTFAKDFTLGLRWDPRPDLMFRLEYHRVNGAAWLPPQDNPDISGIRQHWDMLMLMGAFRF
jgi:hypothetical protein